MAATIAAKLKSAGFAYVTLDLQGYRQGSLNESLAQSSPFSSKAASGT
jgi:PP-loop superfamily ATP-utilizing enzyme